MKSYNAQDILSALGEVKLNQSEILMMHSSPITLGRFDGASPATEIIATIQSFIGDGGTLIAPAFNFDFCRGTMFDRQQTPSKNMGVLSETIRLLPGARRSFHPMQSVVADGAFAADICERDTLSAFSVGGSFDRMLELDAKLLLFGVDFNAASFLHYAEEELRVPYRHDKKFSGEYVNEGVSERREYQMYVRNLDLNPQLDLRNVEKKMEKDGNLRRAKLGMGEIIACRFADLYEVACEMLGKDDLNFLKNRAEVAEKLGRR